uniref:MD-2-related lipid-recognition domain-containing protein n=1 Tax=Arion vulgaris TaxID=1028688 RepID=A0A0B7B2V5_9EUPU
MNIRGLLIVVVYIVSSHAREEHELVEVMYIVRANMGYNDDFGIATNCGKSLISAKWTPKDITSEGQVTLYANLTVPYDMNSGYAEADVYNHQDGSIIFQYGSPFTCEDIQKFIPCPLQKNEYLSMQRTITDLSALSQLSGVFDIVVKVSNEQDQQILCLNATIAISR